MDTMPRSQRLAYFAASIVLLLSTAAALGQLPSSPKPPEKPAEAPATKPSEKPVDKPKEKPDQPIPPLPDFPGAGLANSTPSFLVGVKVSHADLTYREGDKLSAEFTAEREAQLYILCHQADGRSVLLFPNQARRDNRIPAKQAVLIPRPGEEYRFRVRPPLGTEVFQVLASLKPVEELDSLVQQSGSAPVVSRELIDRLQKRLAKDAASWAEHRVAIRTVAREAPPEERKPVRVGLFIGVNRTETEQKESWPRFRMGAELLAKAMIERGGIGGDKVKVLVGQDSTRANIEEAIVRWLPSITRPGDTVFILYTGHGMAAKSLDPAKPGGRDGMLSVYDDNLGAPAGSREEMEGRARGKLITDDVLARWLQELPSRQIVLMLETCHAGSMVDARVLEKFFAQHAATVKGISAINVTVLAACLPDESGYSDPDKPVKMAYYLADAMEKFPRPVTLQKGFEHYHEGQKQFMEEFGRKHGITLRGRQEPMLIDNNRLPITLAP